VSSKKIRGIIGCNLKNDHQILIIFVTNIPDTTGYQTAAQVLISPNVCFCTTWGKLNTRDRLGMNKRPALTLSIVTLRRMTQCIVS